MLLMSVINYI